MRLLRNILIAVATLIAVFVVVGMVLPRHVIVEREIVINAPPEDVFPEVNSLERTMGWSPWIPPGAEVDMSYEGPEEGVGATSIWVSDDPAIGSGRQEITESIENERVTSDLSFDGMGTALAWFDLEPVDGGTRVTWGLDADMGGGPIGRWMGLMMDGWVGADYERGLQNLQGLIEEG